ncbi:MAG: RsmE family RNA methyltransferase, partial [Armatimonadetes bacterium]|nr:RsmE family RNA methyltransferase [Armatimonadota bacterium]
MTQPRIFLQAGEEKDGCLRISGQRAHYLARVLRLRPGDMLVAVTPDGLELQAVIESIAATSVTAKVVAESRVAREPAHNLTLALAVLKSRAMDWALQKATEVG